MLRAEGVLKDALLRRLNGSRVEFIGRRNVSAGRSNRRLGAHNSLVRKRQSNHLVPVAQWTWDQYVLRSGSPGVHCTPPVCRQLGTTGGPLHSVLMRSSAGVLHLTASLLAHFIQRPQSTDSKRGSHIYLLLCRMTIITVFYHRTSDCLV